MYIKSIVYLILFSISILPTHAEDLNNISATKAYEIGKNLMQHEKATKAKEYLKYAADHNDVNAMYRYAILVWNKQLIMPQDAEEYMRMAANHGHEWAMLEMAADLMLGKEERDRWKLKFKTKMQRYIDRNNPDALYMMSVLENDDDSNQEDWLIKASEAGSCLAKTDLAVFYQAKHGWFLFSSRRQKRVKMLFKEAASLGCRRGISGYAFYLEQHYGLEVSMPEWQRLLNLGDSDTILRLAHSFGDPKIFLFESPDKKFDSVKSATYLKIYLDGVGRVSGNEERYDGITDLYQETMDTLNDEEKQKVYDSAKKYLKHHDVKKIDDVFEMEFK